MSMIFGYIPSRKLTWTLKNCWFGRGISFQLWDFWCNGSNIANKNLCVSDVWLLLPIWDSSRLKSTIESRWSQRHQKRNKHRCRWRAGSHIRLIWRFWGDSLRILRTKMGSGKGPLSIWSFCKAPPLISLVNASLRNEGPGLVLALEVVRFS